MKMKTGAFYMIHNPWSPGGVERAMLVDKRGWREDSSAPPGTRRYVREENGDLAFAVLRNGHWVPRTCPQSKVSRRSRKRKTSPQSCKGSLEVVEKKLQQRGALPAGCRLYWSGFSSPDSGVVVVPLKTLETLLESTPDKVEVVHVPSETRVPETIEDRHEPLPEALIKARKLLFGDAA